MNQSTRILSLVLAALGLAVAAFVLMAMFPPRSIPVTTISNFDECAAAGNPIMESFPEQCRTPDGRTFVRDVPADQQPALPASNVGEGCAVVGCSAQRCTEVAAADDSVSTCEYKEEYGCYRSARCERQPNGHCEWTQTKELEACINAARGGSTSIPQPM